MRVQLVTDHMPAGRLEVGLDHFLQMGQEIGLGSRWSAERCHDQPCDDIAADNEGASPMPNIFKFVPLDFAWNQRQTGMLAFESLDSRQLIRPDRSFSLLSQAGSLFIQRTHRFDRCLPLRILWRRQPVLEKMFLSQLPGLTSMIPLLERKEGTKRRNKSVVCVCFFFFKPCQIMLSIQEGFAPWLSTGLLFPIDLPFRL